MPLSGDDLTYLRRRVGSSPDDAALEVIYATYEDRAHPLEHLTLHVLETRLADLLANPASFSVSGEYSQSTGENIRALTKLVDAQRSHMIGLGIVLDGPPPGGAMTVVPAAARPYVR